MSFLKVRVIEMGFIQDFCELESELLEKVTVKMKSPHQIKAFKITSQEDFDLMIEYLCAAHSYCDDPTPIKVNGKFRGLDWYFPEEHDFGSRYDKFYVETLTEKKQRFAEFVKEYQ